MDRVIDGATRLWRQPIHHPLLHFPQAEAIHDGEEDAEEGTERRVEARQPYEIQRQRQPQRHADEVNVEPDAPQSEHEKHADQRDQRIHELRQAQLRHHARVFRRWVVRVGAAFVVEAAQVVALRPCPARGVGTLAACVVGGRYPVGVGQRNAAFDQPPAATKERKNAENRQ